MRHCVWREVIAPRTSVHGVAAVLTCFIAFGGLTSRAALGADAAVGNGGGVTPPTSHLVVAGYERLRAESKLDSASQGEVLLGELNCLACHAAEGQKRVLTKGAPDLANAGARITPQFLRAYLSDPQLVKPGATMPDVFHASAPQAKEGAVEFLTHYLVSLGGQVKPAAEEGSKIIIDQGRTLYHTVGCVACHAPEKPTQPAVPEKGAARPGAPPVPSVPLGDLAAKTTVDQLAAFLMDPLKVRPGGRMPSSGLSKGEAVAIAAYLLRDQLDNPQSKTQAAPRGHGLKYTYYEGGPETADVTKLDPLKPRSQGRIEQFKLNFTGKRAENYAVKFTGAIAIPRDGNYRFWTKSDDGSRLYIDGNLVVDNDGVHAPGEKVGSVQLKAGDHPITVTFFQQAAGDELTVYWAGPGLRRQQIPADVLFSAGGQAMVPLRSESFEVDPQKAQMGKQMFGMLGCANCHTTTGVQPGRPAKTLASLNTESDEGCLGPHVKKGLPQYHLSPDQVRALKAAVKDAPNLNKPLDPKEQVVRTIAAMNCYACHRRDNVGGPTPDRTELFTMKAEFDMGDEGRITPQLTGVGFKLLPQAIERIIFQSELHVRPALATRMPRFKKEAMADFAQVVAAADTASANASKGAGPQFSEQAAKDGRQLFGNKGLGCVNCHGVLGNKSLGMPAPDLTSVHDRLTYPWYSKLMHDPASINPGTRMPAFWTGDTVAFKDIAGGTPQGQIDAMWAYMSLGRSMALPAGLQPVGGQDELIPTDQPIVHRTFMAELGTRAIAVGFPEQLSVAFDANQVRLAETWRGRFFDAKGMWEGRGGNALAPLGTDVLKMPPGPAFATLASGNDPWPEAKPDPRDGDVARNTGGHFKGYALDKNGRPTFHYSLGDVDIHEQPLPVLNPGGATLTRRFTVSSREPARDIYFQAAAGNKIESKSPGVWTVDDKVTVRIVPGNGMEKLEPVIRDEKGGKQLVVPVPVKGSGSFDVEVSW